MAESMEKDTLVGRISDLVAVIRDDGTVDDVNPAVERILGWAPAELRGSCVFDLLHPEEVETARRAARVPHRPFEVRCRHRGGHWVHLEAMTGGPCDDPRDGSCVVSGRDISDREITRSALEASQHRYRRLFEDSRDAICIGTVDGHLTDINPAGVELFGYDSREEMLSLNIPRDLYWNPEDRRRAEAVFKSQGYVKDLELDLRSRDGRHLKVLETASAIYDENGAITGFRGILRDVTAHRHLEEQLRQAQKMEAVGRLASGVAHDFNNLLTAINGYSELVLARLEAESPHRKAIGEIRRAGRRAADLTRRLLTLSRRQDVAPRRLDLNRGVSDMEKLLRRVLSENIELVTELAEGLAPIYADLSQVEQAILNLAVNARDAMPGGGRLEIRTRAARIPSDEIPSPPADLEAGEYALLTVTDDGEGMSADVREHAFEPFFTTKERSHNTGLGLSIVYSITKQLGGHIEVESAEGEGTTFCLYFPFFVERAAVTQEAPLPRGSEVVLLVEDEEPVRNVVQQILAMQGYRVITAENADTALALCEDLKRTPDLLLTDVVMPGRSGVILAGVLERRYPGLKVLFMSGYTESQTDVRFLADHHMYFLAKPFSPESLLQTVRRVLDSPRRPDAS